MTDWLGSRAISIVCQPDDELVARAPVRWAVEQLQVALEAKGIKVDHREELQQNDPAGSTILIASSRTAGAERLLARARVSVPPVPEALGIVPDRSQVGHALLACGADVRGLVYAVLELADRVWYAREPSEAIRVDDPIVERPSISVRSVTRLFTSEINDKPWFQDERFWRRYLSMLATQRFNRFSLTLGLGYNLPRRVTDAYLYFAYPFLVDVHGVRVPQLPNGERERNLQMLRFISDETVARGLDFQLGLWTHAYEWVGSPNARHTIEGLTLERHAMYCRDALEALLEACPAIGGLTLRTHGESGIPERSWGFWRTVLDGVARCGRRIGVDLHAKGLDRETLEVARATDQPLTVSPKYWAEHMGLPYHQAGIRQLERSSDGHATTESERFTAVSEGSRPFTRYGYGDFLREDRDYDIVFRIWPGTQRLLLWGDPVMAAGFGRRASIAGSKGLEWCEPLAFKGREGSGVLGSRNGYVDASLAPSDDWEKYEYTYRLFGRLSYDPDSDPDAWRRYLRTHFGPAAHSAQEALASTSRVLPLVTTAHHPSASNNYYWPELYTDMPIVWREGWPQVHPYYDTPAPKRFGTVSPLDPEIFCGVEEFVSETIDGQQSGRYSPLDVARWLEQLSGVAADHLDGIEAELIGEAVPHARRLVIDVAIQEALGRFFAGKLRAAVFYELHTRTRSTDALRKALEAYEDARSAWTDAADQASGVYAEDLRFGSEPHLRGCWWDRIRAIEQDIDEMSAIACTPLAMPEAEVRRAVAQVEKGPLAVPALHEPPPWFRRGEDIPLSVDVGRIDSGSVSRVRLRYRHMDQSQTYVEVDMERESDRFVATIAADYSDSPFALQYFFVLLDVRGVARMLPGLDADLSNQPYYVVREERCM